MTHTKTLLFLSLILLSLVGPSWSEPNPPSDPTLSFESRHSADRFHLDGSLLVIRSRRGIGEVTVRPVGRTWPPLETLRFEYADGGGMKVLEGLQIISNSPNHQNSHYDLDQNLVDGAVQVVLPTGLPHNAPFLTLRWVDFYR